MFSDFSSLSRPKTPNNAVKTIVGHTYNLTRAFPLVAIPCVPTKPKFGRFLTLIQFGFGHRFLRQTIKTFYFKVLTGNFYKQKTKA